MTASDDDLDELERRMRAKLLATPAPKSTTTSTFTDAERRMAENLVGRGNMERITNVREGRRVRPLPPVVVTYEWYWIEGDLMRDATWRINRVENGVTRRAHAEGYAEDQLFRALAVLRDKGFRVVDANLDRGEQPKPAGPSKRKAIMNRLRFYRP